MRPHHIAVPSLLVLILGACSNPQTAPKDEGAASQPSADTLSSTEVAQSVLSSIDTTADPCTDFYRYACGSWLDNTERPADQSRWGRSFSVIHERNQQVLRDILEGGSATSDPGDTARLTNYYSACMDEAAIEETGTAPLAPWLDKINAAKDPASIMAIIGELHTIWVPAVFDLGVMPDFKEPDRYIFQLVQAGLGMPDRDYYLQSDERSLKLRQAYELHVQSMLELSGWDAAKAAKAAKAILKFETKIAEISLPRAERRDPEKTYNKIDIAGLKKTAPKLNWDAYLTAIGYPDLKDINVESPKFFKDLQPLIGKTDNATLQAYLSWHVVHATASRLNDAIVQENFNFNKILSGREKMRDRWKRCVSATDEAVGELLGQAYVDRQFAGDSKSIALTMIGHIEEAFEQNLPDLAWMDATTRERAIEKMAAIQNKIGYPDSWRDYSALTLEPKQYFNNTLAARRFEIKRQLDKVGQKTDPKEWFMSPPTVNAYYNPLMNEMVFPAGILQRPFFHKDFPAPLNYGSIGMVMGHELSHGFDDTGRKFDAKGQMTEWWDPSVSKKFDERASCVEKQYEGPAVLEDLHINGKLTLGENIADLGGIKQSYNAYRLWVAQNGEPEPIGTLDGDKQFFVGFAQGWCTLSTPEIQRMLLKVDSHSPPSFRVNLPLANFPTFSETFSCDAGTPMNPVDKCEVW